MSVEAGKLLAWQFGKRGKQVAADGGQTLNGRALRTIVTRRVAALRACLALLALLLLEVAIAQSAPRFFFEAVENTEGLTQNTIRTLIQDRTGYLWVGTDTGLQRYDGNSFRRPRASDANNAERLQGVVTALAEDGEGRIWAGLLGDGLWRLDPLTGQVDAPAAAEVRDRNIDMLSISAEGVWVGIGASLYLIDSKKGALLRRIEVTAENGAMTRLRAALVNPDGSLWIASNKGAYQLAAGASSAVAVATAGTGTGSVQALTLGSDGRVYVAAERGLFAFDATGRLVSLWRSEEGNRVMALAETAGRQIWFALSRGGVMRFDLTSGEASTPASPGGRDGAFPNTMVRSLMPDRSGLLWMGTTTRGLIKVDPAGTRFELLADADPARDSLSSNNVSSVHQDADGALWVGTLGDGIKRRDESSGRYQDYKEVLLRGYGVNDPNAALVVRSIAAAPDGRLWVASQFGVAELDPASRAVQLLPPLPDDGPATPVTDTGPLLTARDGSLWAGNRGNRIARLLPGRLWQSIELSPGAAGANLTLSLAEDRAGAIWAGSLKGLHRIDPASGTVRSFQHQSSATQTLSNNIVRSIHESRDGTLWVGTQAGLNRLDHLDADGARFSAWPPSNALAADTIYAILEDDREQLWISSNRGLIGIDRNSGETIGSSLRDGLQSMEFNGGVAQRLRNGDLVFGGLNGINRFNPENIRVSPYEAPVLITDVRIGNRSAIQPLPDATVEMLAGEAVVNLDFAALDYAAPSRNRYRYRLEGYDSDWINAETRHSASYTHLAPGSYTFQLRAGNRDGVLSPNMAKLLIVVPTPWWLSPTAYLIYAGLALIALLLVLSVSRRRRSALWRHNNELLERENRLRMALWGSGDQYWDWDVRRGRLTRTSSETLSGDKRVNDIPIDVWQSQVHPDDVELLRQRMIEHVEGRSDTYESEHRLSEGDDWRWVLARGRVVERDSNGQAVRVSGTSRDITQSRLAEQDRRIARQVLHDMDEAVTVFDLEFIVTSINPAFTRMTGWSGNEIIGQSTRLLDCSQHEPEHYDRLRAELAERGRWKGELWQRRADASEFSSWTQLNEVRDANGVRTHYVGVVSDITERKRSEQELRYLANYDMLTGLPNRSLLSERLARAIQQNPQGALGIVYLDLDRFKHVNDSFGHATGDRLLKAAGDRLRQIVDRNDTVSRLGGDEFTIVLENLGSRGEAEAAAQRVLGAFAQPFDLGDAGTVTITPSIGISLYPDHGDNVAELLKYADTAMYQAKEGGRNTVMVYTEAMDLAARQRATLIAALRKAVERKEFRLVFQPRLSLTHWRLTAVEALLRWTSADVGEVGPSEFIPIAEDTGLIIEIGEWVLRETCAQIARWRSEGIRGLTVSINVSMLQLQRGNVAERLTALLDEFAIPADQIELELTESVVMANAEQSIGILQQLRDVGVTLSIDDFGTGYSSLSYLKRLPIDTLKIDKAFVGDITTDPDDRAITATIIAMAQSLGLNVVAEGVETAAQIEFLREHHCDEIQGYWLSPPLPPDECHAFLQEHLQRRNRMLGSA